jgi:hypothetical protein
MNKQQINKYIQDNIIKEDISYRGGGIEIGLDSLLKTEGCKMTAYQNYLGGGMLGSINNSYNFDWSELNEKQKKDLEDVTDGLNRYFHNLSNHGYDKWEVTTFEECQRRSSSAY